MDIVVDAAVTPAAAATPAASADAADAMGGSRVRRLMTPSNDEEEGMDEERGGIMREEGGGRRTKGRREVTFVSTSASVCHVSNKVLRAQ